MNWKNSGMYYFELFLWVQYHNLHYFFLSEGSCKKIQSGYKTEFLSSLFETTYVVLLWNI
jgi:hypothetical protein